jgi:hypothetical protein
MQVQKKDENVGKPPPRGAKVLLAVGATILSLGLAEYACRLVVPAPVSVSITVNAPTNAVPAEVNLPSHPEQGGLYVETPAGRRLRPNTMARIGNHALSGMPVDIRTNALGYRNREIGPKKSLRILFIGDSITFADYLPEESSYVRQVETMAGEKSLDWETINAGVGAVSLKTELAILAESGLALNPDVVVLGWYLNDFQDSPGVTVSPSSPLTRRSRLAYAVSALLAGKPSKAGGQALPVRDWQHGWSTAEKPFLVNHDPTKAAFYQEVEKFFFDWGGAWSPEAWAEMNPLLEEFVRMTRARGAKPVCLAFPVRHQVEAAFDASLPQQKLAEAAKRLDLPLLDLLPLLRELHSTGKGPLFYDQCHHTPAASRFLAERIFDWLREVGK